MPTLTQGGKRMKFISFKEKVKGRIKKNKEYPIENFVTMCRKMVPNNVSRQLRPRFTSKKKWAACEKYSYRKGYFKCLIDIVNLIETEIDNDNTHTSKKSKVKKIKKTKTNKRGKKQ